MTGFRGVVEAAQKLDHELDYGGHFAVAEARVALRQAIGLSGIYVAALRDDATKVIADLQSARDRMLRVLPEKFGEGFDGDMDTLLCAINLLKQFKRIGGAA